ncbi:MAG: S41 family peptidase, partial [Dehalococcoidia bacterium]
GLLGGVLNQVSAEGNDVYADLSIFTEVLNRVRHEYVDSPDLDKALKGALHGMMEALDPFSSFVDAETFEALEGRDNQKAETGLILSKRYGYAYVVAVQAGSSAGEEGLRSGDLIESIQGVVTTQMSIWEVQKWMRGAPGSTLDLRLIRSRRSQPQRLTLERRILEPQKVAARLVDEGIGYLRIPHFDEGVIDDVRARLKMLQNSGAKSHLIDVRGAARGVVSEAVAAADLLIPRGEQIVRSTRRGRKGEDFVASAEALVSGLPVAVLIDGGSSGAAEVFAAALRDDGVAEIVGERSNGRGSSQQLFKLEDGSRLIISTGIYYRPSGDPLQRRDLRKSGIAPDVRTPTPEWINRFYYENTPEDEDSLSESFYAELDQAIAQEQLNRGIEHLKKQLSEATGADKAA